MNLSCPGEITYVAGDATNLASYQCSEAWVAVPETSFDPSQIDPALMGGAIGAGFFMLVPLWAAILGGKMLMSAIR